MQLRSYAQYPFDPVRSPVSCCAPFLTSSLALDISPDSSCVTFKRPPTADSKTTNLVLQHAFWLIYTRAKAEENYGPGAYRCTSISFLHGYPNIWLLLYRCGKWQISAGWWSCSSARQSSTELRSDSSCMICDQHMLALCTLFIPRDIQDRCYVCLNAQSGLRSIV